MGLKQWVALRWAHLRARQVAAENMQAEALQRTWLKRLLAQAARTAWGADHRIAQVTSHADFTQAVPVKDYEALRPYLDRVIAGEADVLWPGRPLYLAKTSGTTSGSKYIPITRQSMPYHVLGARDALLLAIAHWRDASFLAGRMLFLSGSPALTTNPAGLQVGRLSGIAHHYVPQYLTRNRLPSWHINIQEDWQTKVAAVLQECLPQDLRLISGIPPWVRMFLEAVQEKTGQTPAQVWPNLHWFVQGGVDYTPYRTVIEKAMGRPLRTVEVYPASEGFIALQDSPEADGLLLRPGYGLFFEFIPLNEYGQPGARRLPLWQVEAGQAYALILSSNAGLWAYDIGDVVRFTSTQPYRIKVAGRVKHFISAFGEHVIEEEINAALQAAVAAAGGQVAEFTVAPFVNPSGGASYHEWWVEFLPGAAPTDPRQFITAADAALQVRNAYYADLRRGGMLSLPPLRRLAPGACAAYMASVGRLGGQNKFPRVTNTRAVAQGLEPHLLKD